MEKENDAMHCKIPALNTINWIKKTVSDHFNVEYIDNHHRFIYFKVYNQKFTTLNINNFSRVSNKVKHSRICASFSQYWLWLFQANFKDYYVVLLLWRSSNSTLNKNLKWVRCVCFKLNLAISKTNRFYAQKYGNKFFMRKHKNRAYFLHTENHYQERYWMSFIDWTVNL